MDEKIPSQSPHPHSHQPADNDAQEFMQWMREYGRPAMIGLAVVVVVMLGLSVWRKQKAARKEAAVQALFQGRSPEEFQQLASTDPTAPTAPVALATAAAEFYAQNRYDEALASYRSFTAQYPDHMLVADAELGVAASLEALDEYREASDTYLAFAEANPDHPLQPQAVFGAARCLEQMKRYDEARALYEDFIAANPESSWISQAESGLLFLKKAERAENLPPPEAVQEEVRETGMAPVEEIQEAAVVTADEADPVEAEAVEVEAVEEPAPE